MMNTSENSLLFQHCSNIFISISWIRVFLLLPLSTFVLYLGLQKWRQHRSFNTASHFDIITYHLAAMELFWVIGYFLQIYFTYYNLTVFKNLTIFMTMTSFYGEVLFHTLTCADRYIAVVRPILYLRMRNASGVRIRTISIGCVWLLSLGITSLNLIPSYAIKITLLLCLLSFAVIVSSFCSLSVLCALTHPGPGEKGPVDQSKQRAFHTITVISGMQWLWFLGLLGTTVLSGSPVLVSPVACIVGLSFGFSNLPSCLVLPLLYLHKAGKLSPN